jgi:hypothetical protein
VGLDDAHQAREDHGCKRHGTVMLSSTKTKDTVIHVKMYTLSDPRSDLKTELKADLKTAGGGGCRVGQVGQAGGASSCEHTQRRP